MTYEEIQLNLLECARSIQEMKERAVIIRSSIHAIMKKEKTLISELALYEIGKVCARLEGVREYLNVMVEENNQSTRIADCQGLRPRLK